MDSPEEFKAIAREEEWCEGVTERVDRWLDEKGVRQMLRRKTLAGPGAKGDVGGGVGKIVRWEGAVDEEDLEEEEE